MFSGILTVVLICIFFKEGAWTLFHMLIGIQLYYFMDGLIVSGPIQLLDSKNYGFSSVMQQWVKGINQSSLAKQCCLNLNKQTTFSIMVLYQGTWNKEFCPEGPLIPSIMYANQHKIWMRFFLAALEKLELLVHDWIHTLIPNPVISKLSSPYKVKWLGYNKVIALEMEKCWFVKIHTNTQSKYSPY